MRYAPASPHPPRLMPCPECLDRDGNPVSTVHHCTPSGDWVCWCGLAVREEITNGVSTPEWFDQQKAEPF